MTITALVTHEEGQFAFSGLHQDIFVYRADKGIVEIVETRGMWLGILEDIEGMMSEDTIN